MSTALKIPTANPMAISARPPGSSRPSRRLERHRVGGDDDTERHEPRHRDVEAPDEERAGLSQRDESERHRQEKQVVEVEAREERVLADGREGADCDDQHRHQHERQRAAEPAEPHTDSCGLSRRLLPRARPRADDRFDDPAFPELVAGDLVDDLPARHDDDPVAEAGELERIARLDDHRNALLCLLAQCAVNLEPRGDVDALGRLLGQDDLDVSALERSRQRYLLLVPAGQRLYRLLDRRRSDAQAFHQTVDRAALAASVEKSESAEPPQHLDRCVGSNAQDGEERFGSAVAAQQDDPCAERPERRTRVELLAVAGHRARGSLRTGERPEELHLPVALRARDSDDLAARHLEIDGPEPVAP